MSKKYELSGLKFGELTVIKQVDTNKWREKLWLCLCRCGNYTKVTTRNLVSGKISSCGKPEDFTGRVYGELTVLNLDHRDNKRRSFWKCRCSCGKIKIISGSSLKSGRTISCGHIKTSKLIKYNTTHGLSNNSAYYCWQDMVHRVTHPADSGFIKYTSTIQGKLIEDDWALSPKPFLDYIGERPSKEYSIDRIDPTKGYVRGNVRWATKHEQAINKIPSPKSNTGFTGVSYNPRTEGYTATIQVNNKQYVKYFKTLEEAKQCRYEMEDKYNYPHTW